MLIKLRVSCKRSAKQYKFILFIFHCGAANILQPAKPFLGVLQWERAYQLPSCSLSHWANMEGRETIHNDHILEERTSLNTGLVNENTSICLTCSLRYSFTVGWMYFWQPTNPTPSRTRFIATVLSCWTTAASIVLLPLTVGSALTSCISLGNSGQTSQL